MLDVPPSKQLAIVSHKAIPGVMPAMTMPVRIKPTDAAALAPGTIINFDLVRGEARRIRIQRPANEIEDEGRRVPLTPPKQKVAPGALMPDFTLTDQQARPFRLSSLQGKVIAVQFLSTRCPLPEVCPRLAASFARLQRRFADRMGRDLAMLTITLDPVHDTPEVLSRYAMIWRPKEGWHFLTGSAPDVQDVAGRFGLIYWPEEGVIAHNSTIGILSRDGRLAALVEGLSFDVQQLGDLIETELKREIP